MTLYELTQEYGVLLEMAEDPDVDEEMLADTLEALGGEIEEKADGYAKVLRQMEADAAGLKAEEKRLSDRRRTIENNTARLKAALQAAMVATGKTKFKTELFSFGIQKNPARLVIDRESTDHAPAEYIIIQPPVWDKAKLKEALKAGKDVDGIAHLEQTEGLRIK